MPTRNRAAGPRSVFFPVAAEVVAVRPIVRVVFASWQDNEGKTWSGDVALRFVHLPRTIPDWGRRGTAQNREPDSSSTRPNQTIGSHTSILYATKCRAIQNAVLRYLLINAPRWVLARKISD